MMSGYGVQSNLLAAFAGSKRSAAGTRDSVIHDVISRRQ
jgi:hypothetical protein